MQYKAKIITVSFFIIALLFSGCASVKKQKQNSLENIQVRLNEYNESDFKQVEVTFFTHQSKELVFRVLSDIEHTSQWLSRLNRLEVLDVYNNQEYLLRTIISSPWPFKDRELITCVETSFNKLFTSIHISSCSDRVTINDEFQRISNVESHWVITKVSDTLVKVNYKAWLDPTGNVPSFIFNRELINNTKVDFKKLQLVIDSTSLDQFYY